MWAQGPQKFEQKLSTVIMSSFMLPFGYMGIPKEQSEAEIKGIASRDFGVPFVDLIG
jgi:hypothetical protein